MNALRRAKKTMEKYEEERREHGKYPTSTMMELLARATAYAQIALAEEAQAENWKAGIYANPEITEDEDYEA